MKCRALLLVLACSCVRAADSANFDYRLNLQLLSVFFSDARDYYAAPLRIRKSDLPAIMLTAGMTAALFTLDQPVQDWVQKNRREGADFVFKLASDLGNADVLAPVLASVYMSGYIFDAVRVRRFAFMAGESLAFNGLVNSSLKLLCHRHRPSSGDASDIWDGPAFSTSHVSFPSGHSYAAFSVATVAAWEFRDSRWAPPLAYSLAALVALSRVNNNRHWASDIFFGSSIGFWGARAVIAAHERRNNERRLALTPAFQGAPGIAAMVRF